MSEESQSRYRNITISGLPGSGSTTLLTMLKQELGPQGWQGFNGGDFMRAYAAEKGFDTKQKIHHSAADYEDDFDRQVDMGMRQKLTTKSHWILEAWLSGFMAQGVKGVLKVLLTCSDDAVRVDRLVNRDELTIEEAKKQIMGRYTTNLKKWRRMYGAEWFEWVVATGLVSEKDQIDFWRPDLYDVVIDTFRHNQQQTLELVLNELKQ